MNTKFLRSRLSFAGLTGTADRGLRTIIIGFVYNNDSDYPCERHDAYRGLYHALALRLLKKSTPFMILLWFQ
jgi:hypothetical protein